MINEYKILAGKPEGNIPLGRCVDNIKIGLRKLRLECVEWINLAQYRDL
jgi:hypothetical protein